MKYFNKLLLVFIFSISVAVSVQAQDLHYTMYNMSPLLTNPANTGAFLGTIRLNGIYRSQWKQTYKTPMISADSPIVAVGKKKRDWVGVGMLILNDGAGVVSDTASFFNQAVSSIAYTQHNVLSGAYHRVLDKKGDNVLTFGLQVAQVGRRVGKDIDWITPEGVPTYLDDLSTGTPGGNYLIGITEDEFQAGGGGSGGGGGGSNRAPKNDNSTQFNLGLRLSSQISKEAKVVVGAAVFNPFRFDRSVSQGIGSITPDSTTMAILDSTSRSIAYKRPGVLKLHASLDYDLSDKLRLRPSAFFQTAAGLTETIVQAEMGYYVTDNKDIVLNGGLGYRFGDALQFLVGIDYKDWVIGASYDLNLSPLGDQDRYKSGFEVGLTYIIKIFQDPVVDPVILCPKL